MSNSIYRNKKTKKRYRVIHMSIINATNANDGQVMVLYVNIPELDADGTPEAMHGYVREYNEFIEKFEVI
jgi:hypothetical protein